VKTRGWTDTQEKLQELLKQARSSYPNVKARKTAQNLLNSRMA